MSDSLSTRRMIENEVVFRQENERVQKFVTENPERKYKENKLHFFCECANEDCRERIIMSPATYGKLHQNRKRFIIKQGHEVSPIERVVKASQQYSVVEKHQEPPERALGLQPTPLNG